MVRKELLKEESPNGAKAFFSAFKSFFTNRAMVKPALVVSYAPMIIVIGKLTEKFGKKNLLVATMLVSALGGIAGVFMPLTPDSKGMIMIL